jgi:hypothetical protein
VFSRQQKKTIHTINSPTIDWSLIHVADDC